MSNTLRRDPYWFNRILEDITATLDPEDPYHLVGAHVVVTGTDVAVYVTIPDTLVRFNARQRRPAHYDRTTTVINVVEGLAVDDLDQLSPDPPGDIDRELAEFGTPRRSRDGECTRSGQRRWSTPPSARCAESVAGVLHDVDVAASGLEYSKRAATPSTAPPTTCSTPCCRRPLRTKVSTTDGCWCQPGSCSAPDCSDFPKRDGTRETTDHGRPSPSK